MEDHVLLWSWRNNSVDHYVGYDTVPNPITNGRALPINSVGYDTVPNPITNGRALPINSMSIITEIFEIAFIIITAIIISKDRSKRAPEIKQDIK